MGDEAAQNYNSVGCIVKILHQLGYGDEHDIEPDGMEDSDTAIDNVDIEVRRVLAGTEFEIVWLDDVPVDGFQYYHKDPQFKNH